MAIMQHNVEQTKHFTNFNKAFHNPTKIFRACTTFQFTYCFLNPLQHSSSLLPGPEKYRGYEISTPRLTSIWQEGMSLSISNPEDTFR